MKAKQSADYVGLMAMIYVRNFRAISVAFLNQLR
jgi:hypothetical protein